MLTTCMPACNTPSLTGHFSVFTAVIIRLIVLFWAERVADVTITLVSQKEGPVRLCAGWHTKHKALLFIRCCKCNMFYLIKHIKGFILCGAFCFFGEPYIHPTK